VYVDEYERQVEKLLYKFIDKEIETQEYLKIADFIIKFYHPYLKDILNGDYVEKDFTEYLKKLEESYGKKSF
jgi:iron-sulfur cluster repair protein YtfE (RIC family)